MKKFLGVILFIGCLFLPLKTQAYGIFYYGVSTEESVEVGESIPVTFKLEFSDIVTDLGWSTGVWIVSFEIDYDPNAFVITEVSTPDFLSAVVEMDGKHYVYSEVIEREGVEGYCTGGALYCSAYSATLTLFAKNSDIAQTSIGYGEISIGFLDMSDPNKTYTIDDMIEVTHPGGKPQTIVINHENEQEVTPPEEIIEEKTEIKPHVPTVQAKSYNAYLKNLNISGYTIDFHKMDYKYDIIVAEDVNTLDIKVETEDSKATYEIIGEDDLKANDYVVTIKVTAESGYEREYVINVKTEKKEENTTDGGIAVDSEEKKKFKLTKKQKTSIGIGAGIIGVALLVLFIIGRVKNRRLDKILDKM